MSKKETPPSSPASPLHLSSAGFSLLGGCALVIYLADVTCV
jgi:hypothetical protein